MKIAVIDDYQDVFRTLGCYPKLQGHEILVYNDTEKDPDRLAERLREAEAERENYELYYGLVVDQILAYAGGSPINVLNPAAIGKK
jgi:hypothetical protein